MRALADPLHRIVCKELWKRYKSQFDMVFYLPPNYKRTAQDIMKYNRKAWGQSSWIDHLEVFDLLSDGIVNLYASPHLEKIHYTVYNDKYVLLQAEHEHLQHVKEVWLLESESLAERFLSYAKEVRSKCEYLQPILFKRFTLSISSEIALHVLFSLYDEEKIEKETLYRELKKIKLFQESCLEDLEAIGFIQEVDGFIKLTEDGKEYLKLFI
jgi:hypothetical protein